MSHIPDASFPSDHTAVSIAFVTALFLSGYKKIAIIFLPFALIMNVSRIIS
jgi:membrane-associated phospholipid phosphatase